MIKEFIKYYKPYKKLFMLDMLAAFTVALCDLVCPLITRSIMNDVVPNKDLRMLIVFAITLLVIFIIKAGLNYFMQYWGHVVGVRMQGDMRSEVFTHLQKLPNSYFDNNKSGVTMSKIIINFTEQYQNGMTGFERFMEIMREDTEKEYKNPIELKNVKDNIEIDNVSFKYEDKKQILKNLTLSIEAGKTVALVGPSGGGKTTLCNLIPRFYDFNEGDIKIDGISVKEVSLKSLRKNIGVVQQDVFLFTGTIKENILCAKLDASDDEIIDAAKKAKIHDFIQSLPKGYETYIGERGVKLSGGQKQRISICRVFLKNPPIIILDEATSALDNVTEREIQKSLEELSKDRTNLVIAHRLSTIKNADEIIVLTDSGIVERGNHEELIVVEFIVNYT